MQFASPDVSQFSKFMPLRVKQIQGNFERKFYCACHTKFPKPITVSWSARKAKLDPVFQVFRLT